MSLRLYHRVGNVSLYHGDCREFSAGELDVGCLVYDPQWDDARACAIVQPEAPSILAFTDAKWAGHTLRRFLPSVPSWIFTWDTMAPWTTGPRRPLQQTKHCLWYGDLEAYQRDAAL